MLFYSSSFNLLCEYNYMQLQNYLENLAYISWNSQLLLIKYVCTSATQHAYDRFNSVQYCLCSYYMQSCSLSLCILHYHTIKYFTKLNAVLVLQTSCAGIGRAQNNGQQPAVFSSNLSYDGPIFAMVSKYQQRLC